MIHTLMFDLGNVLVNLSFEATEKAFANLGLTPEGYLALRHEGVFARYETGKITTADFCQLLSTRLAPGVRHHDIAEAWSAMINPIPEENIATVASYKERFRVLLLSNTNDLHYQKFYTPSLNKAFHRMYFSHLEGMKKPEPEFFRFVAEKENILPAETVFIDDLSENTEAASRIGFHAFRFEPGSNIKEFVDQILTKKSTP